jgi:hypothetical protein
VPLDEDADAEMKSNQDERFLDLVVKDMHPCIPLEAAKEGVNLGNAAR